MAKIWMAIFLVAVAATSLGFAPSAPAAQAAGEPGVPLAGRAR